MIADLNVQDERVARELLAVQIPAYRVEAEIIGFDGIPPLHDTWETLQSCGETFYGYRDGDGGELVGAISYEREQEAVTICRMMVHPAHFRKGIAGALLQHLLGQVAVAEPGVTRIQVSTGAANTPAKHLYLRHGFTEVSELEVAPGVSISQFVR